MSFANLKIGVRLSVVFGLVFLFLIIVALTGWWGLSYAKQQADVIVHERNVKTKLADDMRMNMVFAARAVQDYLIYSDSEMHGALKGRIERARSEFDAAVEKSIPLLRSEETRKAIADIKVQRDVVNPLTDTVLRMIETGKADEAKEFVRASLQQPQEKWLEQIDSYIGILEKQNEEALAQLNKEYSMVVGMQAGTLITALLIGIWAAWLVTRSITQPIGKAVAIAEMVAAGDLSGRIEVDRTDEVGRLLSALRTMNESLNRIVSQVRTGTDAIATASSQIAAGNLDLSSRTEEQASSLEETASSMEELTSTVRQNADNARQASSLAVSAAEVANKGGQVVSEVVVTMNAINESANKIADIIGVIDGIAFQTNILALNAAVEAARAGEQGRGFAVVASEVRSLAQRSAGAAKEIKALISDSTDSVEAGARLVRQAGSTMDEIVESVGRVTEIMSEIAAASQEQSAGIEQVNRAISQMDEVTQQNAALVEEAAAAAQSMQEQSTGLTQLVRIFKVDNSVAASSRGHVLTDRDEHRGSGDLAMAGKRRLLMQNKDGRAVAAASTKIVLAPVAVSADEWETF